MKAIHKYIAMTALALSAVACSQSDDFSPTYHNDPDAVRITAQVDTEVTGGFTRSNPVGMDETKFNVNDQIGVFAGSQVAVTYKYDGTSWNPKDSKYLVWQDETMDFKAWYPVAEGTDYQNFTPSYSDNPTLEELAANDYMTFSGSMTRTDDNTVTLAMQRQMVRIVIDEIKYNNQYNETDNPVTSIKAGSCKHKLSNGFWALGLIYAPMYLHTDGKWYAVIPPFKSDSPYYQEDVFLEITVEGESNPLIVRGLPQTEAGNSYSYTLTIGKEKVDIANVDVADWTGGVIDNNGNGDAEEYLTLDATSMPANQLKTRMIAAINSNVKTFIVNMPAEADDMFTAIREALTVDGIADGSIDLTLTGVTKIPDNAFYSVAAGTITYTKSLKSITLPDVTAIGEKAFCECGYMTSVSAPKAQTIGDDAFDSCSGLTAVSLPEVTTLGSFVFQDCQNISKIYLPKVTVIGYYAFQVCSALKEITLGALTFVDHSHYGIFYGAKTDDIDLTLSSEQKVMIKNADREWVSTEDNYKDSDDYTQKSFIGFTFKSITLQ